DLDLPTQETKDTNDNTETLKEQNTSKRYVIAFILLLLGVISSVIIYSKYIGASGKPKTTDDIEEANPQNSEPSDKVSNKENTVSPFADEQRNQQPKPPLTESITEAEQPPTKAKIKMDRSAIIKGLEKNFQLGITEVTVGQYFLFSKLMDRKFPHAYVDTSNASAPMTHVSWQDAMDFCKYIGGRLPTVTEWEFAAKGGAQSKGYVYSGGNRAEQVAWYISDDVDRPQRVKQKTANELGLYDMSGNVNEWCLDHSTRNQSYKQRRGGSWKSFHNALKLGRAVQSVHFEFKGEATGFRVAFDSPSE
ncbi:MAG: SUMF1/EgtB/PvdO family nonheme iron enzyme, partial [Bacteroidota bacterium]